MKKIIVLITAILLIAAALSGCMGTETISAPAGAVPLANMPAIPPGLTAPEEIEGYTRIYSYSESSTLFTGDDGTIVLEYAIAPNAVSVMSAAISGGATDDFAAQYALRLDDGFDVSVMPFMGNTGLLITGMTVADPPESAVIAVLPYSDYFVIVYGFAPVSESAVIRAEVDTFILGFTVAS
ncbi:MAG: hypothetical protein FWH00_03535 [Oscillospiraceae bacterium]|nr:hypothetical protein [Oscillospiraceae bacterium]